MVVFELKLQIDEKCETIFNERWGVSFNYNEKCEIILNECWCVSLHSNEKCENIFNEWWCVSEHHIRMRSSMRLALERKPEHVFCCHVRKQLAT